MRRDLRARLFSLAGVGALVGLAVLGLWQAGVIGRESAGVTESGLEIQPAAFPQTAASAGLKVAAEEEAIAPDFEVSDFEGRRVRLSDFRGKVVFLDFWSTTCIPCVFMIPQMVEFEKRHAAEGLVIFSVNRGETLESAERFLDSLQRLDGRRGIRFTVNALDPTADVFDKYRALGMPYSLIIDEEGIIRGMHFGLIKLDQMEQALALALEESKAEQE